MPPQARSDVNFLKTVIVDLSRKNNHLKWKQIGDTCLLKMFLQASKPCFTNRLASRTVRSLQLNSGTAEWSLARELIGACAVLLHQSVDLAGSGLVQQDPGPAVRHVYPVLPVHLPITV